jgi:hypothetical protein
VHYPSDSEAGRTLAEDFVRFLIRSPAFVRDFDAVQREWRDRPADTSAAVYSPGRAGR